MRLPASRILFRPAVFLLLVVALTVLIYWPGLHGPFLLDDIPNLKPLHRWLEGQLTWQGVVLDNRSGPLGRPVSMLTFVLDVWRTGNMNTFTFKPTNLVVHLLCGISLFFLARQLFAREPRTARHAGWLALAVATAWLWQPLNVSTVLYIIQRMAQLSALFMLLALLAYMLARQRIEDGRRGGYALLWIGVPLLTIVGALSKENALLAPFLAAVLEYTLFAARPRPRAVTAFFVLGVWLPGAVIAVWLALHPEYVLGGYGLRHFTFLERILTEPRILWSYVQTMFVPVGPNMSLFHDNYPISTSLWQPWTTLSAILAWVALALAALVLRKRQPLFAAGVGLFLVGHAMESSIFALELYFEHRNYFPGIGMLLAVAGLLVMLFDRLPRRNTLFRPVCVALLVAILLVYAGATHVRARSWSSSQSFYAVQAHYNHTSPRLQSNLVGRALTAGNLAAALKHIAIGERYAAPSEALTATLWRFIAYCEVSAIPPQALYREFAARNHGQITNYAMVGWEVLANRIESGCPTVDRARLVTLAEAWLANSPLPDSSMNMWRTRYNLARVVAVGGNLQKAADMAYRAWVDGDYNNGIGVLVFQLNASLGHLAVCREVLSHLERATGGANLRLNKAVATFKQALADGDIRAAPPQTPARKPRQ